MTIYQAAVFALRLRTTRELRFMTQIDLAAKCNVTSGAICNYEHRRSLPTIPTLVLLADALCVETDYLLGRDEYAAGVHAK